MIKHSKNSYLYSANGGYLDALYEDWLRDPERVPEPWRQYFGDLVQKPAEARKDSVHSGIRNAYRNLNTQRTPPAGGHLDIAGSAAVDRQVSVLQLINAYRFAGHRQADLDPLSQYDRPEVPELSLEHHRLGAEAMDSEFNSGSLYGVPEHTTLRQIFNTLTTTYCGTIGCEYMHMTDTAQKRWIQSKIESSHGVPAFSAERKRMILDRLVAGNALEEYLHRKYVGQKRFSLEGGVALIPMLHFLIERAAGHQVREIVLGMAHRGRLNVLVNVFGKSTSLLFEEFEGVTRPGFGSGDVKYHKGFSSDLMTEHGTVHTVLAFNPSHLEVINPVVEGSVRARQQRRADRSRNQVVTVLIHGDAAFAGQGVVMETLNLSQTRGYSTGGTVHLIINNQIGFTTSDPLDSRSTLYCTDVGKMVQAPIFHVNGDDAEAVVYVTELALDFRMKFNKDVVVDLVCYRRHGHSEADEPSITQPIMYECIRNHPTERELYSRRLLDEGLIQPGEVETLDADYLRRLKANISVSAPIDQNPDPQFLVKYRRYVGTRWTDAADTRISTARLLKLGALATQVPEHFALHRRVQRILDERRRMAAGELPMDWGFAELLAYAALLEDGYAVRLSGQDSARGTFAHRHAALHDQGTGEIFLPLQHMASDQPQFLVINSLLSEQAVLGFEVGYSTAEPETLVIWEAQFGDFANNAQVIVDQFISSSEAKWQRYCGIVLFLPHGYDGQGPEHSSARLERYLQLCAEENMQVCVPTTPAQMFHLLRRQMLRPYRKPLIIMTPKSLLRHKLSVSTADEITRADFQLVIDEIDDLAPQRIDRLLLCSGKVYFDLLETRREHQLNNVAIIRIEQQYPFPSQELSVILERYRHVRDVFWVQEEPRNQGAWFYMLSRWHLRGLLTEDQRLDYVGRRYFASPAVGYLPKHHEQQRALVSQALDLDLEEAQRPSQSLAAN